MESIKEDKFRSILSTPYFDIEESVELGFFNNDPYYRMTANASAICCIMNNNGEFIMVRQFRPNLDEYTLEFPAGGVDVGETPIQAAGREIAEETGYSCSLIDLGAFCLMMNRTNIRDHIFFGMDIKLIENYKKEENIDVIAVSRKKFIELSGNGGYLQLAGLGILQVISLRLGIDVLHDSIENIFEKFSFLRNDIKGV